MPHVVVRIAFTGTRHCPVPDENACKSERILLSQPSVQVFVTGLGQLFVMHLAHLLRSSEICVVHTAISTGAPPSTAFVSAAQISTVSRVPVFAQCVFPSPGTLPFLS